MPHVRVWSNEPDVMPCPGDIVIALALSEDEERQGARPIVYSPFARVILAEIQRQALGMAVLEHVRAVKVRTAVPTNLSPVVQARCACRVLTVHTRIVSAVKHVSS